MPLIPDMGAPPTLAAPGGPAVAAAGGPGGGMDLASLDPQQITQVIQAMMQQDQAQMQAMIAADVQQMMAAFTEQQRQAAVQAVQALLDQLGGASQTITDPTSGNAAMLPGERLHDPDAGN